jgi:hypothetical protein
MPHATGRGARVHRQSESLPSSLSMHRYCTPGHLAHNDQPPYGETMRTLLVVLGLLGGCDSVEFEPEWSERVWVGPADPVPAATCADMCVSQGMACMANACDAGFPGPASIQTFENMVSLEVETAINADCDEPLANLFSQDGEPWSAKIECCCTAGVE